MGTDGTWTVANPGNLVDGGIVTATVTDPSGNTATATETVSPDVTAPSLDINPIEADSSTPISGTSDEIGAVVTVTYPNGTTATATVGTDGTWTVANPGNLVEGQTVTATVRDLAGNVTNATESIGDVSALAPTLKLNNDSGTSNTDNYTNDGVVKVSGLESGATWKYSVDGGNSWTTGIGTSFTLPEGVYGSNKVLVQQIDAAGNVSSNSALPATTVDLTVVKPSFAINDYGVSNSDNITWDYENIKVSGIESNAKWEYSLDGGTTWSVGAGDSFSATANTTYAPNKIQVRQTDLAGNTSAVYSNTSQIVFDNSIATPFLQLAVDSGTGNQDGISNNGKVNVSNIDSDIVLFEYSIDAGQSWINITGQTSFTLPEGVYDRGTLQTRVVNRAGIESIDSHDPITIDQTAPFITLNDLSATAPITGTSNPFTSITVMYGAFGQTVVSNASGVWSVPNPGLTNGQTVTATATDLAGNKSNVATKAIPLTTPTSYVDNVDPGQGTFVTGTSTNDTTPSLVIPTLSSGQTAKLYVDGVNVPATYNAVDNTLTPTTPLVMGTHNLTYSLVNSGVETAQSGALTLTVDTTAPTVTSKITGISDDTGNIGDWVTTDHTLTVNGTITNILAVGDKVQVSRDGVNWIDANVNGTNWTAPIPATLATGNVTFQTRVIDAAQNASAVSSQAVQIVDLVGINNLAAIDGTVKTNVATVYPSGPLSVGIIDVVGVLNNTQAQNLPTLHINDGVTSSFTFATDLLAGIGAGGALLDVVAYKLNPATGVYESYQTVSGAGLLIGFIVAVGTVTAAFIDLPGGEYKFAITSALNFAGIAVSGSYTYNSVSSTDYGSSNVTGNVIGNDIHTGTIGVSSVSSEIASEGTKTVISGTSTIIVGQHGTLTINLDGSYDYVRLMDSSHLGKTDTFTVTVKDQWGNTSTEQLNVQIGANGYTFNASNPSADATGAAAKAASFMSAAVATPDNASVTSTAADDTITSTSTHHNTLIFNVLNDTDATGGNGHETWNGFSITPSTATTAQHSVQDVIDISDLLSEQHVDASNIDHFITALTVYNTQGGKDTVISIDRDGTGSHFNSTDVLTLKNVDTSLDELIKNHQLLY